ncbi:hypothetical protein GGR92_000022 [Spirosoma lacussanchae]|nr:hypothetical protein [Spirosoma lacussanchae]
MFATTPPTPTASTGGSNGNAPAVTDRGHGINLEGVLQTLPTPTARSGTGAGLHGTGGPNLQTVLRDSIPTPTANGNHNRKGLTKTSQDGLATVIKDSLPTPAARDYKGANSAEHLARDRGHHDQLPNALALAGGPNTGLKLQPEFTEWLMGMPLNWTNPDMEVDYWQTAPASAIEHRDLRHAEMA